MCGGILIFEGWRLDPILLLCQILSSGITISFIIESLCLRQNKNRSFCDKGKSEHYTIEHSSMTEKDKLEKSKIDLDRTCSIFYQLKIIMIFQKYTNPIEYINTSYTTGSDRVKQKTNIDVDKLAATAHLLALLECLEEKYTAPIEYITIPDTLASNILKL